MGWGSSNAYGIFLIADLISRSNKERKMRKIIAEETRTAEENSKIARGIYSTETFYASRTPALPFSSQNTLLLADGSDSDHFEAITRTSTVNLLASGGSEWLRNQAITYFCRDALAKGKTVITLHCGNSELQRHLKSITSTHFIPVDGLAYHYDPFSKMISRSIAFIVVEAAPETYRLPSTCKTLVEVIAELQAQSGEKLTLKGLINCPVNNLIPVLDKRHRDGRLNDAAYNRLMADYVSCQRDADLLMTYLLDLKRQLMDLPFKASSLSVDYERAVRSSTIISIDVSNSLNDLVIELITEHIRELFRTHNNIAIVLDGLNIHYDNKLIKLLQRNRSCNFAISSPDAYAAIGAKKDELDSLLGADCRLVLSRHGSPRSAAYWSEYFNEYERTEILTSFNEGQRSFMSPAELTRGYALHKTKERKILPDVFKNLTDRQFCAYNAETGQTLLAEITI